MWGLMYRPQPTMRSRILAALQRLGRVNGRADIMKEAGVSVQEWNTFTSNMRIMLGEGEVVEERVQLPATGIDGPPVFDYYYSVRKR